MCSAVNRCVFALCSIVVASLSSAMQVQSEYACLQDDCDRYEVPARRERVCRQYISQADALEVEWYTGSLAPPNEVCSGSPTAGEVRTFCPGYVGMTMGLLCDFDGETVIYKDGAPLTGGSNVTYSSLQKEHEGLYQCVQSVNGSNEVVGEFNMTVRSEIHMGGDEHCNPYFCYNFRGEKCCRRYWHPFPTFIGRTNRQGNPYRLIAYGDEPIEITHDTEWVTNYTVHYPTDLGVFVTREKNDSMALNINFYYTPYSVNCDDELKVDLRITASNNFSSFSICLSIEFQGECVGGMNANTSLPLAVNAMKEEDAVFMCEFGGNSDLIQTPQLHFELMIPGDYDDNVTLITTICTQWTDCDPWTPTNLSISVTIQTVKISNVQSVDQYRYEVRLAKVAPHLHGTVFSCSMITLQLGPPNKDLQEVIQWKGSAQLYVQEPMATQSETLQIKFVAPTSAVVTVVLLSAVVTVLLLAAAKVWRKSRYMHARQADTIPLTGSSQLSTSRSTLNSEEGTAAFTIPSIQIMEVGGRRRDLIVGEMLQETHSMDSGVSCSEEEDSARRPSSLQISREDHLKLLESTSPVRLCRSETDVTALPVANPCSPRQKINIYISYTDYASRWVRTTLKPMIDSWNIAEVTLPERDMVAGKAVSNERRRLIVEANKIIIVISPDYYDSDWCSFELMHAIQNEPTLSRGRIIPVLLEGCRRLPQNMEVVVPLFAHEQDFSQRLMAAVYSKPRLSR